MSTSFEVGILYTPASIAAASSALTIPELKQAGIKYIRLQWVEPSSIVRLRLISLSRFEQMMESSRPGICLPHVVGGYVFMSSAEGFGAAGEHLYVPDMSSVRICPYAPETASVFGWLQHKDPCQGPDGQLTVETDFCMRSKLRDLLAEARKDGIEFLVGFESEFNLLESVNPVRAGSFHQYSATRGLLPAMRETKIIREIFDALDESGVKVDACHPEAGPGQYEIATAPFPPLEAADALIHTRETIINIASKHGMHATFAPRISMTAPGNAAHMHISVHKSGYEKSRDGLSALEKSFLAGILDDLTALPSVTTPIPASYKRVGDGVWTGGTYVAWGTESRECPIRLCNAHSPGSRNLEMKFIDGAAVPYLVATSIIALGYAGIKSQRELRLQDFTADLDGPAVLSEQQRQALGITQRLPLSWEEGRKNLSANKPLREALGSEFVDTYLSINKTLAENLSIYDEDEEKALTRLVEFC